jgi:hypothetical protein
MKLTMICLPPNVLIVDKSITENFVRRGLVYTKKKESQHFGNPLFLGITNLIKKTPLGAFLMTTIPIFEQGLLRHFQCLK